MYAVYWGGDEWKAEEQVTQWTSSSECQRHDDIDPADLSPSVSLTEVTGLFIKMEIEPCYSHAHRQTLGTEINSSKNKCTCTWICTLRCAARHITSHIYRIHQYYSHDDYQQPILLFEHERTYTNISSTSANLCYSAKETLQTDAEQINRGSWGKGTQGEGSKALS